MWMLGGQIQFEFPMTVTVIGGEILSRAKGAWGAAPTDGCSASTSGECLQRFVSKPSCNGVPFGFGFDGDARSWCGLAVTARISRIFCL